MTATIHSIGANYFRMEPIVEISLTDDDTVTTFSNFDFEGEQRFRVIFGDEEEGMRFRCFLYPIQEGFMRICTASPSFDQVIHEFNLGGKRCTIGMVEGLIHIYCDFGEHGLLMPIQSRQG